MKCLIILLAGLAGVTGTSHLAWAQPDVDPRAGEVTDRAVPNALPQTVPPLLGPGRAAAAGPTLDQTVAALQQQVQSLTAQVAALQSVLKVTPAGAILQAPALTIQTTDAITVRSGKGIAVDAGTTIEMKSSTGTSIRAGSTATIQSSGILELRGSLTKLNGGTKPIATVGSQVQVPGQPIGQIVTGNPTILGN